MFKNTRERFPYFAKHVTEVAAGGARNLLWSGNREAPSIITLTPPQTPPPLIHAPRVIPVTPPRVEVLQCV
jgi:hypothetical protein